MFVLGYDQIALFPSYTISNKIMADPPIKPWEINRTQSAGNIGPLHSISNPPVVDASLTATDQARKRSPPPVPNRPSQRTMTPMGYQPSYGGYGSYGYGTGYGGMYGGGMGSGMYGGYGGGGMYGSYNRSYGAPGGFARQAEESTRNAFQSVESIVRAFTSVSAMLESTLGAVYSSFRAVLDVADQFSRVRATFADILSSIAVFRLIRFLYRRALAFLNLGGSCEEAWDTVKTDSDVIPQKKKSRSWPILLFMSVVIGGPYLIWKLLSGTGNVQKPQTPWASGLSDHVVARVEYDFEADNDDELTVKVGDLLNLAPKDQQPHIQNWLMASLDGTNVGMVPATYVKVLGRRKGRQPESAENGQPEASAPPT
ncbi:peroxisomal membrane protein PEX13-like [Styela clava]